MPRTAFRHFQEDIARAKALVDHADPLPADAPARLLLRDDVLRSAWMFAVGALDAYFCDAYTDLVAATIISKSRHPAMTLPEFFGSIRFPISAILEPYAKDLNWKWRMAARRMMERETVLSLETIQTLFNKFFRPQQKLFGDVLERWILHPQSTKRVFNISPSAYNRLTPAEKNTARQTANRQMQTRFADVFQRRHDCIHNCDRPRVAPQQLPHVATARSVIEDVEFLVARCDDHINGEFRQFLLDNHCPAAVVAQAGY